MSSPGAGLQCPDDVEGEEDGVNAMADDDPPITISELVRLTDLGIALGHVTWTRVTMTSDSHICVRYERASTNNDNHHDHNQQVHRKHEQLLVFSLAGSECPLRTWTVNASSAMISPAPLAQDSDRQPRVAIKSGNTMMVLRMEPQWEIVTKCQVEEVTYWSWISDHVIGMVTPTQVLHWDTEDGGTLEEMFDRHPRLASAEIIAYKADIHMKWFALTGLLPQDNGIQGVTQLYSVEHSLAQCITAHAVTFAQYRFEGNQFPSTVLCAASRDTDSQGYGKVHVIELGPHKLGNLAPCSLNEHIKFAEEEDKYDFPVAIQVSPMYGLLYLVTKYGHLYLLELESACCLCQTQISPHIIFITVLNSATEGIISVTRGGQVLSVDLKTECLVDYIQDVAKKHNQASRLAKILAKYSPEGFGQTPPANESSSSPTSSGS